MAQERSNIMAINPFKNRKEERQASRQRAEDDAALLITQKNADNVARFVDQLNSIDFVRSKLPKEILNAKSRTEQPYGDLEYAARIVIQSLKELQTIKTDIRKFDEKLMTLVLLFKQTVEQGDVRAAYAAKGAVARAVLDIRSKIPQDQPELAKQFVEANAKYLDHWITLINMAQVADRTRQNVENQRALYKKSVQKDRESNEKLRKEILEDPEKLIVFNEILEHGTPEARSGWTEAHRELHKFMVERRMGKVTLDLNAILLQQQELVLAAQEGKVEVMYSKVAGVPIITNPNLMAEFQDAVDALFQDLIETDAQIEESLRMMDEIDGRIAYLELSLTGKKFLPTRLIRKLNVF